MLHVHGSTYRWHKTITGGYAEPVLTLSKPCAYVSRRAMQSKITFRVSTMGCSSADEHADLIAARWCCHQWGYCPAELHPALPLGQFQTHAGQMQGPLIGLGTEIWPLGMIQAPQAHYPLTQEGSILHRGRPF